ncbi:hypothetical protein [Halopseudomonas maritima]|uniref:hypothetical protein n=1 Tax=Halopseudomonas maritima TaxID=2918528 RepID=UPI001EECBE5C|nr:hypothetical protein [Halopseudomonas maritima]UJJ32171.1 hypothetical protein HV822_03115 [Halopseudomonas maritima]
MLIPGLPPAGAQNDAVKTSREVKPSAASEPLRDTATPQVERRHSDRGRWPDRRRGKRKAGTRREPPPQQAQGQDGEGLDLPDKGLLVDIEV